MRLLPALLFLSLGLAALAPNATADRIDVVIGEETVTSANGTVTIPVQVVLNVDTRNCVAGGSQALAVTLTAATEGAGIDNSTGGLSVTINPTTLTFEVPPGRTIQGPWASDPKDATLVVTATGNTSPLDVQAIVSATSSTGISCGVPTQRLEPDPGQDNVTVEFAPQGERQTEAPQDEPVPGLELPMVAAAVLGLALVMRRRR